MNSNVRKEIKGLVESINRLYCSYNVKMDEYYENPKGKKEPCLYEMIESQFSKLSCLAPREAQKIEWMTYI